MPTSPKRFPSCFFVVFVVFVQEALLSALPFSVAVSLHLQTQFGEVLGKNGCKA